VSRITSIFKVLSQTPERVRNGRFHGPEIAHFGSFQAPEIKQGLCDSLMPLKLTYLRGLK
jgi:hypothetical protein